MTDTPVRCTNCGQEWPRDPALEVPCPVCRAGIGQICRRPSGHRVFGGAFHPDRDRLAMMEVAGYGKCPASIPTEPDQEPNNQLTLFATIQQ